MKHKNCMKKRTAALQILQQDCSDGKVHKNSLDSTYTCAVFLSTALYIDPLYCRQHDVFHTVVDLNTPKNDQVN